ncbi:MAG: alpha/beta hydrolase [Burkholderiales bacterium]|nr:alpha/beta hydrolase [Burkholderiales bacterium]
MAEQTLILGAEKHLVATLTPSAPRSANTPPCVAVLSNSGVIPRSGPHRMNVHLARRFAQMGIPSIRFDMSGLGDSQRSSGTLPVLTQWVADTRTVMDAAQSHFQCNRFFMVGFCSGAEVAHLVALEDPRMRAAVLWDLYAYPTLQSRLRTFLYRLQRAGLLGLARKLQARLQQAMHRTDQAAPDNSLGQRAIEASQVPPREEYARRIQTLVDGGVELLVAYCGGEPEWFNHADQFRNMFSGHDFIDRVAVSYLSDCDHLLTRREAQQAFSDMTVQWLQQRVLPAESKRT